MLSKKSKQILSYARRGLDAEEIAEITGDSPKKVRKAIDSAYKSTLDEGRVNQVFNHELGKLAELNSAYFDLAVGTAEIVMDDGKKGLVPADPDAAKIVLSIHDRIAKMTGINAPEKMKITHAHEDFLEELE